MLGGRCSLPGIFGHGGRRAGKEPVRQSLFVRIRPLRVWFGFTPVDWLSGLEAEDGGLFVQAGEAIGVGRGEGKGGLWIGWGAWRGSRGTGRGLGELAPFGNRAGADELGGAGEVDGDTETGGGPAGV
jgi:hypothetical protein